MFDRELRGCDNTGKEMVVEDCRYYSNARWYDPELGRFITEDPVKDGSNWFIYALNNPLKFVDPTGLLHRDPNNYNQVFDNLDDTLWEAAENAGYDDWKDALSHIFDSEGNSIDISDRYDDDGNWIEGSDPLTDLRLEHNPEKMTEWTADESLILNGVDFRFLEGGLTLKGGYADVSFSSENTSFEKRFTVESKDSAGLICNTGHSKSSTQYTKMLPHNITEQEVIESYLGYFRTIEASVSLGPLSFGIGETVATDKMGNVPENPWRGGMLSESLGGGKGISIKGASINLGATITHYSDPLDITTKLKIWDFGYANLDGFENF